MSKLTAKLGSGGEPAGKGFVRIEPGTFTMGSPSSESGHLDREGPTRRVTISRAFALQATEVTQGQWKAL
ncbi:MAG: formylglycine-generating enzyme family protein, partial [Myxococcota bacterium]